MDRRLRESQPLRSNRVGAAEVAVADCLEACGRVSTVTLSLDSLRHTQSAHLHSSLEATIDRATHCKVEVPLRLLQLSVRSFILWRSHYWQKGLSRIDGIACISNVT